MPDSSGSQMTRERYHALDVIRGFCLILMLAHHLAFDFTELGWLDPAVFEHPLFIVVQAFFASCFVALSGASCRFSRNNFRRAWQLCAVALAIWAVTALVTPELTIRFGIVHMLGLSTLLYALAGRWLDKVPWWVWPILFALTYGISRVYFDIPGLFWLGIRTAGFSSGDYYPMMPWFFMYMLGVHLGGQIREHRLPRWFYELRCPFLESISRWSLVIFLVHQPLFFALSLLLQHFLAN